MKSYKVEIDARTATKCPMGIFGYYMDWLYQLATSVENTRDTQMATLQVWGRSRCYTVIHTFYLSRVIRDNIYEAKNIRGIR